MKPADPPSRLNTTRSPRRAEAIESEAADWLALRAYRPLTLTEQSAFDLWLAADTRHAAAVADLESAWRALDGLAAYPRPAGETDNPDFFARPRTFRRTPWLAMGAAAVFGSYLALQRMISSMTGSKSIPLGVSR